MDSKTKTEAEAHAFRRLVAHLAENSDEVQNIDLMILADFCRNCLAKWLKEGAETQGAQLSYEAARELVYGEPFESWKSKHQQVATEDQLAQLELAKKRKAGKLAAADTSDSRDT